MKDISNNTFILISSAHNINDDMMYYRYAKSLYKMKAKVVVIGRKIKSNVNKDIKVIELNSKKSRLKRFTIDIIKITSEIKKYEPKKTIIFLFTPDLLLLGLKLVKKKYTVVQVYVENYPEKILEKEWIMFKLRKNIALCIEKIQEVLGKKCFSNIFVDTYTMERQSKKVNRPILLPNYPIEIPNIGNKEKIVSKPVKLVYAGGIGRTRGLDILMELINKISEKDVTLTIYGNFEDDCEKEEFFRWVNENKNVIYKGYLPYNLLLKEIHKYDIGLAFYKRKTSYKNIGENTTKIFEYMQFGLPVITQDFPILNRIISEDNAGICVDTSKKEWIEKIIKFINNTDKLKEMSISARESFKTKRNWRFCEQKLNEIFEE